MEFFKYEGTLTKDQAENFRALYEQAKQQGSAVVIGKGWSYEGNEEFQRRLANLEFICKGMAHTLALLVQALAEDDEGDENHATDLDGNPVPKARERHDTL